MAAKKTTQAVVQELLTYQQTAEYLGISENHLFRQRAAGKIPQPIRIGHSIRWSRSELEDWIAAGGPSMSRWQNMRRKRK